jgi:serine/threonine-protein kinase SRPK3/serine/threonine-protein kinase SRPK1
MNGDFHQQEPFKHPATKRAGAPNVTHEDIRSIDLFTHESVSFKIADLGNACWEDRHFSEDIQTRQYRSPEVLIGSGYDTSADIWSLACMIFELVTGDYLFDPKGSDEYPRDEDHLALMIELLGPLPESMISRGKKSATFFNRKGELRHIKQLRFWGLTDVLIQKYHLPPREAADLSNFILPMLELDPTKRVTARQLLSHPWLSSRHIPEVPAPTLADVWLGDDDDEDAKESDVILNSPGYSSARSEAI